MGVRNDCFLGLVTDLNGNFGVGFFTGFFDSSIVGLSGLLSMQ